MGGPEGAPCFFAGGFVVHAVQDVVVFEGVGEHLVDEALLVLEDDCIVSLFGGCEKEGLTVNAGVVRVFGREAGLLVGVVDVVFGVVWVRGPVARGIIEAVPDFDLYDYVAFGGPAEHVFETVPVFFVPLVEVVLAIGELLEGLDFEVVVLAVAHGVADVVCADGHHFVEVLFEVRDLEEAVVLAAADEHEGFALVLPVSGVCVNRPDAGNLSPGG